jgi:hypothetical protein
MVEQPLRAKSATPINANLMAKPPVSFIEPIATLDIGALTDAVKDHRDRFGDETWRQDAPATPHPDTETLYLRMPPVITPRAVFESLIVLDRPLYAGAFREAVEEIAGIAGKNPARAMVINLKPGGKITRHRDEGAYAEATERYHLPVITNPDAWLEVGDQRMHMEAGTFYRFAKHVEHEGANQGETDRIHLVVDLWR